MSIQSLTTSLSICHFTRFCFSQFSIMSGHFTVNLPLHRPLHLTINSIGTISHVTSLTGYNLVTSFSIMHSLQLVLPLITLSLLLATVTFILYRRQCHFSGTSQTKISDGTCTSSLANELDLE